MTSLTIRRATLDDLPSIVSLLANDTLGATREDNSLPLQAAYVQAFEAIDADANQFLADGLAVGTLQLSFLPYISHLGSWRAQIEAVRVHEQMRGSGLGRRLFEMGIRSGSSARLPNDPAHLRPCPARCSSILRIARFHTKPYGFQNEALIL